MSILIDGNRVEFLGIEIIFTGEDDPRGSVWISFDEAMSLLYGRNGAGKSTILNAIYAFMSGRSLEDSGMLVHGYARLIDPSRSCWIINQSIKSMPRTRFLSELEGLTTSDVFTWFDDMKQVLGLPYERWEPSLFGATPDSSDDLEVNWDLFVSHFLFLGLWEVDCVHDLPALKSFAQHLIDARTFCLRATGQERQPEWAVSLAAMVDDPEVRSEYEHVLRDPDFKYFDQVNEHFVSQVLLDTNILANRGEMPRTNSPFISAARIANQTVTSIGISAVDLNEAIDLEEWTKRRVAELVHSLWVNIDDRWFTEKYSAETLAQSLATFLMPESEIEVDPDSIEAEGETVWSASFGMQETAIGRTIEFEFLGERYTNLQNALSFVASQLPEELAITNLRLALNSDLGLWIFDKPGVLEAYDNQSQRWIPVSSTSGATQKIIGMALKIHSEIRTSSDVTIAVGDEIDQGLHSLAISGLYKMLADSIPTCFIATHSSVALSSRLGERLHVHRAANGAVLISHIGNFDFISLSASNFGVRVTDLIGAIDLVVAVEGLHDKLVLEHFIQLDERLANSNILIIVMTGVNNATNLIDANFLLSFTDLRVLAVADNTSKTDLQETQQATSEALRRGQSPSKLAKSLRARAMDLKTQRWHEQYCMVELLAAATEVNLLARLRVSGHTYPDIEMALDPKYFGLDKGWLELEAEFKEFKTSAQSGGKNFKDFLRSFYRTSIDQRSIEVALSMTQAIPSGIKSVLDDIVVNAFRTDLLHDSF